MRIRWLRGKGLHLLIHTWCGHLSNPLPLSCWLCHHYQRSLFFSFPLIHADSAYTICGLFFFLLLGWEAKTCTPPGVLLGYFLGLRFCIPFSCFLTSAVSNYSNWSVTMIASGSLNFRRCCRSATRIIQMRRDIEHNPQKYEHYSKWCAGFCLPTTWSPL